MRWKPTQAALTASSRGLAGERTLVPWQNVKKNHYFGRKCPKISYRHCAACFSCTPSENFVNCSIRLKELRVVQKLQKPSDWSPWTWSKCHRQHQTGSPAGWDWRSRAGTEQLIFLANTIFQVLTLDIQMSMSRKSSSDETSMTPMTTSWPSVTST